MATALDPKTTNTDAGPGSERTFGLVFAGLFVVIGGRPLLHGAAPYWWSFGIAVAFAIAAFAAPAILWPLNWLWHRFGLLLHKIMSPLLMGAIFFIAVTPVAVIMRLLGKDMLSLLRRRDLKTYWIARETPGSAPDSMKQQF
jgi:Saxitoxin biosynthesis operon protein SxtJ